MKRDHDVQRRAAQIRAYLAKHPSAADTFEGVCNWWLQAESIDLDVVNRALQALVAEGVVIMSALANGATIYSRGGKLNSE